MDRTSTSFGRGLLRVATASVILAFGVQPASGRTRQLVQGQQAISFLNDQRVANGIPPVTDDQHFASAWCPAEDTGPHGGELARVLSPFVYAWGATSSPWDEAPLHQQAMYNPTYTRAGDVDRDGQACMGLGAPVEEPALPAFFSWVSASGPQDVPTSEVVSHEGPFAPQQLVGIPQGKPTGEQIFVYAEGMGEESEPVSWTLSESDGNRIAGVRMAVERQAQERGAAGFLPDVGVLVPPVLRPETEYTLAVIWQAGVFPPQTQTVSFQTGIGDNVLGLFVRADVLYGESEAPNGALTLVSGSSRVRVRLGSYPVGGFYRTRLRLGRLHSGLWKVCIASGGHDSLFRAARRCADLSIG